MEENKTLMNEEEVIESVYEDVDTEETAEETPAKIFTQEEFNSKLDELLAKKIARKETKIRKEYEQKYGNLENVLKAGTGKESVEEVTDSLTKFYQSKGIDIPQKPKYSANDIETLATADANEIISYGSEDVEEELERLSNLGVENMTAREKSCFQKLMEHSQSIKHLNELEQIGVTEEVYNSKEFQEFKKQFNSKTPIANIYNMYKQMQPRKEFKTMGSMKNTADNRVKDFYTPEEIDRMTEADLDNPKVWEAVRRSMTGGK